jgi:hypothetical protein
MGLDAQRVAKGRRASAASHLSVGLDFTVDSMREPADNYGTPSQPQERGDSADHWIRNGQLSQAKVVTDLVIGLVELLAVPRNSLVQFQ